MSEVTNIRTESPLRQFFVYLRDGRTFAVSASGWIPQAQPDDLIKFYDAPGVENESVFLRATDTSAIAPDSATVVAAPVVALQNKVDSLTSRLDTLETSLPDMLKGAVAAALSERGL